MQLGISTASLFGRYHTEDALSVLNRNNVKTAEVFLETFWEYSKKFGKLLKAKKGSVDIHSVHTLTTQFEPTLYSLNDRAQEDSFKLLKGVLESAKVMGAKHYTFHGPARIRRTPLTIDFERVGKITQRIIDECDKYGVKLAYENVHWAYYNYVGYFKELKSRTCGLKATLDIKQARQSGVDTNEFIKEMGKDIVTVHLSDIDENGKMCLPGKGTTNFEDLFSRLKDEGFDGAFIIEAYKNYYDKEMELFNSLEYITDVSQKVFR